MRMVQPRRVEGDRLQPMRDPGAGWHDWLADSVCRAVKFMMGLSGRFNSAVSE
jgi:hypothetical protein